MTRLESSQRLPPDLVRSLLAATLTALAFGGWIYSLARPEMRAALGEQAAIWWAEQLLLLVQAVLCLGILLNRRTLVPAVIALTALMLLFGAVHWWQALMQGRLSLPVTWVLNSLFFWRLRASRRTPTGAIDAPAG